METPLSWNDLRRLAAVGLLVTALACSGDASAQVTISKLPAASTLTGSEIAPVVQSAQTRRTTISGIFALLLGRVNSWTARQTVTADGSKFGSTSDSSTKLIVTGASKGVRLGTNATGGVIEGVDQTAIGSYQPLLLGGSAVKIELSGGTAYDVVTTQGGQTISGSLTLTAPLKTQASTVSGLPSASGSGAGARSFVSDAVSCTFGATVSGGGSTPCPVWSDGSAWKGG